MDNSRKNDSTIATKTHHSSNQATNSSRTSQKFAGAGTSEQEIHANINATDSDSVQQLQPQPPPTQSTTQPSAASEPNHGQCNAIPNMPNTSATSSRIESTTSASATQGPNSAVVPNYALQPASLAAPANANALLPGAAAAAGAAGAASSQALNSSSSKTVQRPAVFDKLEALVQDMQDKVHGVPVRNQKVFLTAIPFAFMGYDLIEWLMDRLSIEDSLEAVHLANLLCQFGYYFPIGELRNLLVKDDSSLYRFQSPYYWPSQHHTPDNIEYAIYLAKRSQQRKREKHGLEDFEVEAYNNLKKILSNKWEFVQMQADEQLKVAKDRKKDDKHIVESQERAYWRVYRPPPGYTTVVESAPVPTREYRVKARNKTKEHIQEEVKFLREYVSISRCKVSFVAESLIDYTDTFLEYDPMLCQPGPSNPWITDDQTHWLLNQPIVDTPTEKRVRKWELSLEDLVLDPLGVKELMEYMKKEYSHENLRFWLSVQELRYGPGNEAKIKKKVKEIWDEFLAPGAKAEINIDGKTMESTKQAMKNPSRFTFEVAASHVYLLLLKKDCYPRFIRSENYKSILANAINPGNVRRRIFNFPKVPKRQQQKSGTTNVGLTGTTAPTGRTLEDFNVYGIHGVGGGGDSDSPPDGPDDLGFPQPSASGGPGSGSTRNAITTEESICPWELDDKEPPPADPDKKKAPSSGQVQRRGSDPTALASSAASASGKPAPSAGSALSKATRNLLPSETAAAVAAVITTPLETLCHSGSSKSASASASSCALKQRTASTDQEKATGSAGLDQISSATSKSSPHEPRPHRHSSENSSSSQSHHHHHHHHHHHAPSRRAKNRSRKKKPSRAASSATENDFKEGGIGAAIIGCGPTSAVSGSNAVKSHDPLLHQHSAASLLSSVAAASVAMASMDTSVAKTTPASTATPTTATSSTAATAASAASAASGDQPQQHPMETKCTQTKLDEEDCMLLGASAASQPTLGQNVQPQSDENPDKKPEEAAKSCEVAVVNELDKSKPEEDKSKEELGVAAAASTASKAVASAATTESKGEIGTWTSSTEVCPWEDEENQRESHAPFVKTYATLGYL